MPCQPFPRSLSSAAGESWGRREWGWQSPVSWYDDVTSCRARIEATASPLMLLHPWQAPPPPPAQGQPSHQLPASFLATLGVIHWFPKRKQWFHWFPNCIPGHNSELKKCAWGKKISLYVGKIHSSNSAGILCHVTSLISVPRCVSIELCHFKQPSGSCLLELQKGMYLCYHFPPTYIFRMWERKATSIMVLIMQSTHTHWDS